MEKFSTPKNLKREYGYGTLIILILFAVFSSYGLESYILGLEENKMARREVNSRQAVYAAEGGIEWAKAMLEQEPNFLGGKVSIVGTNVQVQIVPTIIINEEGIEEIVEYEVTSEAKYESAKRKLIVTMEKNGYWQMKTYEESNN